MPRPVHVLAAGSGDFNRLAERLASIAGRFILSVNDVPGTRLAFKEFVIEEVVTRYTLSGGAGMEAVEILVMGPGADPQAFLRPRVAAGPIVAVSQFTATGNMNPYTGAVGHDTPRY